MAFDGPCRAPLHPFNPIYGSYGHRMVRILFSTAFTSTAHLTSELLDAPS